MARGGIEISMRRHRNATTTAVISAVQPTRAGPWSVVENAYELDFLLLQYRFSPFRGNAARKYAGKRPRGKETTFIPETTECVQVQPHGWSHPNDNESGTAGYET